MSQIVTGRAPADRPVACNVRYGYRLHPCHALRCVAWGQIRNGTRYAVRFVLWGILSVAKSEVLCYSTS
ncbi:MAG: hypothetical protein LIO92_09240 [Clostridiales bacterium]|nr:hypothetical protein [Clostridiales bacterium]